MGDSVYSDTQKNRLPRIPVAVLDHLDINCGTTDICCCAYYEYSTITYIHYKYSCWLSTDQGVIWAFVGPMLLIIAVS